MIPMEVADIANIILSRMDIPADNAEDAHNHAVEVAWDIYNQVVQPIIKSYEQAHLEGSY